MDKPGIEVLRNYTRDELLIEVHRLKSNSMPVARIISESGETIEQFSLNEKTTIIPVKKYLHKNYSVRINDQNNVFQYAL